MGSGPQFATVEGSRVAYEVHGEDDLDIVYSPGLASHLDMTMEQPRYRHYIESLGRFGRVIRFDRRGTGISDPAPEERSESWEIWLDDLRAVLDAAGSEHTAILATNDAGGAAMLFAATFPERVRALVLFNTSAMFIQAPDYPAGHPAEVAPFIADGLRAIWGTEDSIGVLAPSLVADEPFRLWYSRFQRAASSPAAMAESMTRLMRMDARHVLAEIQCPTLVIHRTDYGTIPIEHGRYLAEHISTATFLEVAGADAPLYTQGMEPMVDAIGAFLGKSPHPEVDDRQFATVLFTDIVSSTERAAQVGDHAWHRLLDAHDSATQAAVRTCGGKFIKSTGDGILATFSSPSRAIECAQAINAGVLAVGLEVRVGLHAGPIVIRHDGDIGGLAVHAAARVMSKAGAGELWVSGSIVGLVTDPDIPFADRGSYELKGVPGQQQLFSLTLTA